MRIHLVVNMHRPDAVKAAQQTADFLEQRQVEVGIEADAAHAICAPPVAKEALPMCNLVISFGGDGTLIRAAQMVAQQGTPILGVYYGRFGFVTQCHPHEVGAALSEFLDGKALIEERMMVRSTLYRGSKVIVNLDALNECSIQRVTTTRMIDFEISVDGHFLTRYPADGVVVATPTGSTAYNLSTGGPIVDPHVEAILLSAIAPHTLSARSFVLQPNSKVSVSMETRGDAVLSVDGFHRIQMASGDRVVIERSPLVTRLVMLDPRDFLVKLSERILWSNSAQAAMGDDE